MVFLLFFLLPFYNLKKLEKHLLATESGHEPIFCGVRVWKNKERLHLACFLIATTCTCRSGALHGKSKPVYDYANSCNRLTLSWTLTADWKPMDFCRADRFPLQRFYWLDMMPKSNRICLQWFGFCHKLITANQK